MNRGGDFLGIGILLILLLLAAIAAVAHGQEAEAAQVRTLQELITERDVLKKSMQDTTKAWEANKAEFEKRKEWIEYNTKQLKLQQEYGTIEAKLRPLDAQIADLVTKQQKK